MSTRRKRRKNNRRKGPGGPPDPQLPQKCFDDVIARVNALITYYERSWPDGVDPTSLLKSRVDSVVRWYNSGDRSPKMYRAVQRVLRLLEVDHV